MSNTEQVEYWNSKVGDTWARMQERLDLRLHAGHRSAAVAGGAATWRGCARYRLRHRRDDAGAGRRGGRRRHVRSASIFPSSCWRAPASAPKNCSSEAEFRDADAATFRRGGGFDLIVSRFGVMFFADPGAAFANLHRLAGAGGRLCLCLLAAAAGESVGDVADAGAGGHAAAAAAGRPARAGPLRLCRPRACARHSRGGRLAGHRLPRLSISA